MCPSNVIDGVPYRTLYRYDFLLVANSNIGNIFLPFPHVATKSREIAVLATTASIERLVGFPENCRMKFSIKQEAQLSEQSWT